MSLAPSSSVAPLPALGPAPANHIWTGSRWVHLDSSSALGPSESGPWPLPSLGPSSEGGGWTFRSEVGFSNVSPAPAPAPAPAPLPQRSLGGGIASVGCALARTETGLGYQPSDATLSADVAEAIAMHQIRTLRAQLQIQQRRAYEGTARSHSDMALADAEHEELDRKIAALEACMTAFGAWFRTG